MNIPRKVSFLIILIALSVFGCKNSVSNASSSGGGTNSSGSTTNCNPSSNDTTNVTAVMDSLTNNKQELGVNYNGQFSYINYNDLQRTKTKWVRGFIDVLQLYQNPDSLATNPDIVNYLKLKAHGYKTILNLKWNFSNSNFPNPYSTEMSNYEAFLKKILDLVWNKTDVLVIGNEPFIETKSSENGYPLVQFYETIATYIHNYETGQLNQKGCTNDTSSTNKKKIMPLFVGAFNNLYEPSWQTSAVQQLLSFAKSEPWIAGIDLHIHHNSFNQLGQALNYVNNKIRTNQKIIITEFSLVKYFKSYMTQTIPASFASKYGLSSQMENYQYINQTLQQPVSRKEWVDFLSSSSWFENEKSYVLNAYKLFITYKKFAIATYGIRQSYPYNANFTANTMPWILNSIYANRTVVQDSLGQNQFNYAWINDFLDVQNGTY